LLSCKIRRYVSIAVFPRRGDTSGTLFEEEENMPRRIRSADLETIRTPEQ